MISSYFNFFGSFVHNPIQLISYSAVLIVMTLIAFFSIRSRAIYLFPAIFLFFSLSIFGWIFYFKEEDWVLALIMGVALLAISFLLFYIAGWVYSRYK